MAVTTQAATRRDAILRRRPAGPAVAKLGLLLTLVSFTGMSWYTVSGPNVIGSPSQLSQSGVDGTALVASPDAGSRHSWLVWTLLMACAIAVVIATLVRTRWATAARVVSLILASILVLIITAVEVLRTQSALLVTPNVPSGTTVTTHAPGTCQALRAESRVPRESSRPSRASWRST